MKEDFHVGGRGGGSLCVTEEEDARTRASLCQGENERKACNGKSEVERENGRRREREREREREKKRRRGGIVSRRLSLFARPYEGVEGGEGGEGGEGAKRRISPSCNEVLKGAAEQVRKES